MGTCYNCGTQITLEGNQTKCDKCGNVIRYTCWNCKTTFETSDDKGDKRKECKICGYFICPHCGECGQKCQKKEWRIKIKEIIEGPGTIEEKTKKMEDYFETQKTSKERKECVKCIPITYAKGRIKSLLARMQGFRVKNEEDKTAFNDRIKEITDKPIGTKMVISKIRKDGTYGQEYRDAFNLLVCMGKLKLTWEKIIKDGEETGEEFSQWERINNRACSNLEIKKLIVNECPQCHKVFSSDKICCSDCMHKRHSKFHKKGEYILLKKRLTNEDVCKMYRGDFHKKDGTKKQMD